MAPFQARRTYIGSKTRSLGQILENHVDTLEGTVLIQSSLIYVKMFVAMKKGQIWKWVFLG